MAFEKLPPRWEAAGVQPTEEKMTSGWLPREKVPAPWLNWYFNGVYESLKELQEKAATDADLQKIIQQVEEGATGLNGWKIYNDISEFGLAAGTETIDDIVQAMPDKSELYFVKSASNTSNVYPATTGMLNVRRFANSRVELMFSHGYNNGLARKWYGWWDVNTTPKFSGWKEVADVEQAQMSKITTDTGGVKLSVSDTSVDFLAKIAELGQGMHTFYCIAGAVNAVPTTIRGHAYFTASAGNVYGYILGVDHIGNTWTNYSYGTGWRGWRKLVTTEYEPPNLLKNSTGAMGLENWKVMTTTRGTWVASSNNPYVGSFFYTTSTNESAHYMESDTITVAPGTTYHLQAMFNTSGITSGSIYIAVFDSTKTTHIGSISADLNTSWHRKQKTITIPSGVTSVVVRVVSNSTVSGGKHFSRIKFCKSDVDAPYSNEGDIASLGESLAALEPVANVATVTYNNADYPITEDVYSFSTLTSLSSKRQTIAGATDGAGNVVFAGGVAGSTGSSVTDIERYDKTGKKLATAQMTVQRYDVTAATDGNGNVLIGGGSDYKGTYSDVVNKLTASGVVTTLSSLTYARRMLTSATDGNGSVLFLGGSPYPYVAEKYANTGTKTTIETGVLPYQGAAATDGNGDVLFAGGYYSTNYVSTVRKISKSGVITALTTLSANRSRLAAATDGEGNVLFGGGYAGNYSAVVEKYTPSGVRTILDSLSVARCDLTAHTTKSGNVVFVGGGSSSTDNRIDIYRPDGSKENPVELPYRVNSHGSAVDGNGNIIIAGGFSNNAYIDTVEKVTVDSYANMTLPKGAKYKFSSLGSREYEVTESQKLVKVKTPLTGYVKFKTGEITG